MFTRGSKSDAGDEGHRKGRRRKGASADRTNLVTVLWNILLVSTYIYIYDMIYWKCLERLICFPYILEIDENHTRVIYIYISY